ncbi:(2Fe-2S)-binding protein [Streptosporangium sp. DT93]|uniref:(2Fe-2S)-binding protein n=1 Tax=Streptosporangium sp. DT93 TaxID=3393428 RepID=UPI003CED3C81
MIVPRQVNEAERLAPVTAALRDLHDRSGLAPDLVVRDDTGWMPATWLTDGSRITDLLDAAHRRWQAAPHVAASLAWKSYSYWLVLPSVIGWASALRVPLLYPADVLVRIDGPDQFLAIGLRPSVAVAVLPSDALARFPPPTGVHVAGDEVALLEALRLSLLDAHLTPLLEETQARVRIGRRALLGSVSSGIAHGILRATGTLPGSPVEKTIHTLLQALGIADLIELVPGPNGEPTVRRKTCCLQFTVPGATLCTSCCIRHR